MQNAVNEVNGYWASLKPVFTLLGFGGLTVAGAVAVAWALFNKWGEEWMKTKFAKNLEDAKAEQARQMEQLKHRINSVFDRVTRLHTREFDVLPDIWGKLVDAYSSSLNCLAMLQQYAPVDQYTDKELEELFDKMGFTESEKESVRTASPKLRAYQGLVDFYKLRDANDKLDVFNMSFRKLGLFVKPEIKVDIDKMHMIIREALFEKQINREYRGEGIPPERERWNAFEKEGRVLFDKLEKDISERLWDSTKAEI